MSLHRYGRSAAARLLAGLVVVASLCLLMSAPARASEPIFPPASRVGLAPPPDFVLSTSFMGFQHNDKQARIVVAELPGFAFESIEQQILADLQGSGVAQREDFTVKDGGRAFLLRATRTSPQGPIRQWTVVATLNDVTAVVTALIPEAVEEVAPEAAVRASFASLVFRSSVPVEEQLSVLPFRMKELAGYRIVRVQPWAAAILTDGPKDSVEADEQPLLLISIAPIPTQPRPEERDGLARRIIADSPGLKEMRITRSEPLRIAGQQGHEVLMEAKDAKSDTDVTVVQWLRFGTGTMLRMLGMARKDAWSEHYPRFRQVRDGIGPR